MEAHSAKDPKKRPADVDNIEDVDWNDDGIWREMAGLFFQAADYFRADTPDFHDFKDFFHKYIKYKKFQKSAKKQDAVVVSDLLIERHLSLPVTYDARYKVNFSLQTDERTRPRQRLSEAVIAEVRRVLHMYEEFMQRKNFNKLVKIRQDRSNLPIAQYETQIAQTLVTHQVIVIAGDTGCGKSTQVPQFLLKAGYEKIACTQPRRIATMSLCRRVSYETLNEYGSQVAYQIRFETSKAADTRILFLTELASDSNLTNYSVLIIDEVHERHIQGDFMLGILRRMLPRRPDLKVILMSATINLELFSGAFNNCPIIKVPGRMYPIDVNYRPIAGERNDEALFATEKSEGKSIRSQSSRDVDAKPYLRILQEIDQVVAQNQRGDLLIFMSGIKEITTIADPLRQYGKETGRWIVLMCHSSLSVEEQEKVFDLPPDGVRKCIIATNICETAVTIDGIRFVIDSGKVKEMGFDTDARMQSLQEFWVSKASAEQRKGRAGRTGPGVCYRLYDIPALYARNEFDHFLDYSLPEIRRIPLEATALQIKALGLGDPRIFEFVERPEGEAINTAMLNLKSHQLINNDATETITPLGEVLSRLPVDISIGKMLVLGAVFRVVDPVLSIAAALSVQSPFVRIESQEEQLAAKRRFEVRNDMTLAYNLESSHGDPFMLLNIFDEWVKVKADNKENSRKWCKRHFLEEQRLYEMAKLKRQFRDILVDSNVLLTDNDEQQVRPRADYTRRDLRRLQLMQAKERGRQVLKFDYKEGEAEANEAEEEEDSKLDIRNLDFALTHNISDMARASSRGLTVSEVNVVKMVITSGFYPNVSVADEANSSRKESDSIFHTKWQRMVLLHPQSSLAGRALNLAPSDLLIYQSLLRTNKSYLVNPMPASAAHTLLLFSNCIDTTPDCSRLLVDNWIEFSLSSPRTGERLLLVVHQLRLMLQNLLRVRLLASADTRHMSLSAPPPAPAQLTPAEIAVLHGLPVWARRVATEATDTSIICNEELLSSKLAEFLEAAIPASWDRAKQSNLPALFVLKEDVNRAVELQTFAAAQEARARGDDPMAKVEEEVLVDAKFEEKKGGVRLSTWLRYGSLQAERPSNEGLSSHMRKHWDCAQCGEHFVFSGAEIDEHKRVCSGRSLQEISKEEIDSTPLPTAKGPSTTLPASAIAVTRSSYRCSACDKNFLFTPTEALRHKHPDMAGTLTKE